MIPDYQTAMLPTLRSLGDGAVRTAQEVRDFVAREFKVTEDELRQLLPSGTRSIFSDHVSWALTYMKKAGGAVPSDTFADFLAAAQPSGFVDDFGAIERLIAELRTQTADIHSIAERRAEFHMARLPTGAPWQQGYAVARRLRSYLGLNGHAIQGLRGLAEVLGSTLDELQGAIIKRTPFSTVDGLLVLKESQSPAFATAHANDEGKAFAISRCLFDYFVSDSTTALVTKSRSDRQKRNRAFAAEFLLPAASLRAVISGETITTDNVDDLADRFGVSAFVVRHQIENHKLARLEQFD